jgi:hypothetical protein
MKYALVKKGENTSLIVDSIDQKSKKSDQN